MGAAAFAVHVVLLALFWPIPPTIGSYSAPQYLLGNLSVLAVAWAAWRAGAGLVEPRKGAIGSARWRLAALALLAAAAGGGVALRFLDRDLYFAFWHEEGVFEPVTVLAYTASAAVLWKSAAASEARRPWRLAALALLFLALEEIDWFGIFGGLIGRIDGAYAGSLHDVIRLTALGIAGWAVWTALGAVALVAGALLWRAGWLDPRWIGRRLASPEAGWVALAAALLALAAAEDAEAIRLVATNPTLEEPIEMGAGLALAAWAIESAAKIAREEA